MIRASKAFLIVFAAVFSLFVLAGTAYAHGLNQPSFFKIDGQLVGYNDVLFISTFFEVPQDKAPENYLVNQELDFEIDVIPLQVAPDVLQQTTFNWDFGDGTTAQGLKNSHRYTRPGSYVVNITSTYGNGPPQQIESALVEILPYKGYQLPKAVILVNGSQNPAVVLPFTQPISFDATKSSSSSKIVSYTWDFNDQTSGTQPVCQHRYDKPTDWQMAFVLLRVKDDRGFFSDTCVELINQNATPGAQPPSNASTVAPPPQGPPSAAGNNLLDRIVTGITTISGNLIKSVVDANTGSLLALAFLLVFLAGALHALTPGHGKSIMAVFLCGKKGSNMSDVLTLAGSITFTHTIVIFMLGLFLLLIDRHNSLGDVLPYFEKIAALVVAIIAFTLIRNGWQNLRHPGHHDHGHDHSHSHSHHHPHPHPHVHESTIPDPGAHFSSNPDPDASCPAHPDPHLYDSTKPRSSKSTGKRSVLFAGIGGGIVPCTDAFALLLLLVSAGKALLGIIFVLIFSAGLACSIVLLGLLLVMGKKSFNVEGRLGRAAETYAPIVSGILLAVIAVRLLF